MTQNTILTILKTLLTVVTKLTVLTIPTILTIRYCLTYIYCYATWCTLQHVHTKADLIQIKKKRLKTITFVLMSRWTSVKWQQSRNWWTGHMSWREPWHQEASCNIAMPKWRAVLKSWKEHSGVSWRWWVKYICLNSFVSFVSFIVHTVTIKTTWAMKTNHITPQK